MKIKTGVIVAIFLLSIIAWYGKGDELNTIAVSPNEKTIGVGENFTILINITPVEPIQIVICNVTFNSTVLKVLNVEKGEMFEWFYFNETDNKKGHISYIIGFSLPGEIERGTLAIITFQSIRTGISSISIEDVKINGETAVNIINGTVNVGDTIPPDTFITDSPSSITKSTNVTIKWNGTDNVTPWNSLTFSYMLENFSSSWSPWTHDMSVTFSDLPAGSYTFKVKAKDEAGNIDDTPAIATFTVETPPPSMKNVNVQPMVQKIGGYVNISCNIVAWVGLQDVFINVTKPDGSYQNVSIIENKINDIYYYNDTYSLVGAYNFSIYAIDLLGRGINGSGSFRIVDMTPPNVKISYPKEGDMLRGKVEIRWNATDNHDDRNDIKITIKYSGDDGTTWHKVAEGIENSGNYTWNTSGLKDGKEYRIMVLASDKAGNEGRDITSRFIVDNTPPSLEIEKPKSGYIYIFDRQIIPTIGKAIIIGKISVQVRANDSTTDIQKIEFYVDGELKESLSKEPYEWIWKEAAIGKHEIEVKAYDKAGNIGEEKVDALVLIL